MVTGSTRDSRRQAIREARREAREEFNRKAQAREAAKNAVLDAEAERVGLEWGLGTCQGVIDNSQPPLLETLGVLMVVAAIFLGFSLLGHLTGKGRLMVGAIAAGLLALGVLVLKIPKRRKRDWLGQYEAGFAHVTGARPRVVVVRWDELAALSLSVVSGYDEESLSHWTLSDHRGRAVGCRWGPYFRGTGSNGAREIISRAESMLAERHVGPLIRQLDAGQRVTIGPVTVDRSGIRSRGDDKHGGRWQVSWQKARNVDVRLHGQRAIVEPRRGPARRAVLDGVPNSFVAAQVIAHAARQAGVPVSVDSSFTVRGCGRR